MTTTRCDGCGRKINEKKRRTYRAMKGPHCPVVFLCNRCLLPSERRGFSLVELLIVIVIITILLALAMPMLTGVHEAGRELKCKVNLRSMAQGLIMYMDEGDRLLPVATRRADARSGALSPFDTLGGSMGVPMPSWDEHAGQMALVDPWVCPSDEIVAATVGFSYQYEPWAFFSILGPDQRRAVTNEIVLNKYPVFSDFAPHDGTINVVVIDGTVRELLGRERR